MDGSRGWLYPEIRGNFMGWFPSQQVIKRLEALEGARLTQRHEIEDLRRDLSEASHNVRSLDLDMVGLEDKVKAFTGRISVRKRQDRKEPEPEVEPQDLNALIRDGKLTQWP